MVNAGISVRHGITFFRVSIHLLQMRFGHEAVTALRSDGPEDCSNNAGWRGILFHAAHMMMP